MTTKTTEDGPMPVSAARLVELARENGLKVEIIRDIHPGSSDLIVTLSVSITDEEIDDNWSAAWRYLGDGRWRFFHGTDGWQDMTLREITSHVKPRQPKETG